MASKLPSIPAVPTSDPQTYQFLSALKENVESMSAGTSTTVTYVTTGGGGGSGSSGTVVNGGFDGTTGIETVTSLPSTNLYIGRIVFLTTDSKLYRYTGTGWTTAVPAADLTGQIVASQVADAAITVAKFATGIKPIEVVTTLPATGNQGRVVFLTSDNKMYRDTGSAWVATIPAADVTGQLTNSQLAAIDAAKVTGQLASSQIADAAITTAKFASGIEPVTVVTAVPGTKSTNSIFNTTDGKLYRWNGTAYVATVSTADLAGTISDAQIAGLAASKVTGQLTDSQLAAIAAAKVTGQLVSTQIADAAVTTAKFASGIEPVTVVSSVPGTKSTNTIVNTADGKLYRWNGTAYVATVPTTDLTGTVTDAQIAGLAASKVTGQLTNSQIADLAAAKLTGQITSTQITDNSITTAKIAANAVTASQIAADTITASQIAANAITSSELAAGAVVAGKIAAGTIQAADIAAGTITGDRLAANTITASQIASDTITAGQIATGAITASELAANAVTADSLYVGANSDNMVLNPGAEGGSTAGWAVVEGSGTFTAAGTPGVSGSWCFNLATGNFAVGYRALPVVAGATYSVAVYVAGTAAAPWYLRFNEKNTAPAGTYITQADRTSFTDLVSGANAPTSWTKYEFTYTVPAGVRWVSLSIYCWGVYSLYFDEVEFRRTLAGVSIKDGAISAAKIAANTITASQIASGTITSGQIAASTITGTNIAGGTITGSNISAGTIQASNIAAGTITGDRLAANTITASQIASDTITAGQIAAGAIGVSELSANAVTAEKLAVVSFGDSAILNPGFEDPSSSDSTLPSHWTRYRVWGGTTTTAFRDSSVVLSGTVSLGLFPGAGASADMFAEEIPLVAGDVWCLSFWAKASGTNAGSSPGFYARVRGGSSSTDISVELYAGIENIVVPATWTKYSVNFTIPSGMTWGCPFFLNYVTNTGHKLNIDDVQFRKVIGSAFIADGAITATKIQANTITASQIASGTITGTQIAASTITGGNIAGSTITGGNIAAGTITAGNIATDTITAGQIAAGAIGASEIAAGAVNASKIAAGSITSNEIASNTITAGNILAGTITASQIASNTITGDRLVAGTITAAQMATGTITAASGIIGSLSVGLISSSVNGGVGSGGRVVIDNTGGGRILIYDSSNVLRLRIGYLL